MATTSSNFGVRPTAERISTNELARRVAERERKLVTTYAHDSREVVKHESGKMLLRLVATILIIAGIVMVCSSIARGAPLMYLVSQQGIAAQSSRNETSNIATERDIQYLQQRISELEISVKGNTDKIYDFNRQIGKLEERGGLIALFLGALQAWGIRRVSNGNGKRPPETKYVVVEDEHEHDVKKVGTQ